MLTARVAKDYAGLETATGTVWEDEQRSGFSPVRRTRVCIMSTRLVDL
ncbi:hypothetical protein AA0117_g11346 [Alternaria alternata]|uniref:Uncharacterized protein n=1 Tax=Alternaria alternata TaxID=5599 RepID=A0A4Q4N2N9_ALTAL|nr:hypothetical protein AA0117_g11346 [Alternaria alternata]